MYNLKRVIQEIAGYDSGSTVNALVNKALAEVEAEEKSQLEAPQEMRDMFAAVALVGILMRDRDEDDATSRITDSWDYSDAMMNERAKRIEARKAV